MFKKIMSYLLLLLLSIFFVPTNSLVLHAEELNEVIVLKTVDEDLQSFDFNYERYFIDKSLCYRPIVLFFNEAVETKYYDLLYLYDPNNLVGNTIDLDFILYKSENDIEFKNSKPIFIKKKAYFDSTSSDNKVKRYYLDSEDFDKSFYQFRRYDLRKIDNFDISCSYDFTSTDDVIYSNSLNIRLDDAHNWSYRFDEDTSGWENFKDLFKGSDTLKDQLFYSFAIPNDWDIYEIKSVDIQYKTVLLEGYSHTIPEKDFLQNCYFNENDDKWSSKFYEWNESNSADSFNTDKFLGYNPLNFGNKVPYTYKTVKPEKVSSNNGKKHYYEWNTISTKDEFREAFKNKDGEDTAIYKFASQFLTDSSKKYIILNYDSSYFFHKLDVCATVSTVPTTGIFWFHPNNKSFIDYLKSNGENLTFEFEYLGNYIPIGYYYWKMFQEYTFDVSATSITYEDSSYFKRTASCSVYPVMQPEGSGGGVIGFDDLTNGLPDWLSSFLTIFGVLAGITLIVLVFVVIDKITGFFNKINESRNQRLQNKILKKELEKKDHGKSK